MSAVNRSIIEMGSWLTTPAGAYARAWLQEQLDRAVVDAFGYHALQLGLPEVDGLRSNRMPHRWLVHDLTPGSLLAQPAVPALHCEFHALPFPSASIDLVVMPHTLEMTADPHATLAEVARVLVPEGRVVIVGFNPMSLWGLRQWAGFSGRLGRVPADAEGHEHEHVAEYLGYRRVRDWLRLLSFEIEGGRFGLWRPPMGTASGLERLAWMDRVGSHWWPVLGGMYAIEAVKRVRGMRLVGMKRKPARRVVAHAAVVAAPSASSQSRSKPVQEHSV
jgi:SAM-dependent methyltransferase